MVAVVVHFQNTVAVGASDQFVRDAIILIIIIIGLVDDLVVLLLGIARHLGTRVIFHDRLIFIGLFFLGPGLLNHRFSQRVFNHIYGRTSLYSSRGRNRLQLKFLNDLQV